MLRHGTASCGTGSIIEPLRARGCGGFDPNMGQMLVCPDARKSLSNGEAQTGERLEPRIVAHPAGKNELSWGDAR